MKKITLLAAVLAVVSFASCKKTAKCECTTVNSSSTENGVSQPTSNATTVETREIAKTSKKNAAAMCGNSSKVTTSSNTFGGTTTTYVDTQTTTCSIK